MSTSDLTSIRESVRELLEWVLAFAAREDIPSEASREHALGQQLAHRCTFEDIDELLELLEEEDFEQVDVAKLLIALGGAQNAQARQEKAQSRAQGDREGEARADFALNPPDSFWRMHLGREWNRSSTSQRRGSTRTRRPRARGAGRPRARSFSRASSRSGDSGDSSGEAEGDGPPLPLALAPKRVRQSAREPRRIRRATSERRAA